MHITVGDKVEDVEDEEETSIVVSICLIHVPGRDPVVMTTTTM